MGTLTMSPADIIRRAEKKGYSLEFVPEKQEWNIVGPGDQDDGGTIEELRMHKEEIIAHMTGSDVEPVPDEHPAITTNVNPHNGSNGKASTADIPPKKPKPKPKYESVEVGEILKALDRNPANYGRVVSDDGDSCTMHFDNQNGGTADVPISKSDLRRQNGQSLATDRPPIPAPISLGQFVSLYPNLAPPVIDCIVRRGETANVVSSSKARKTWMTYGMMLSVATGKHWLDTFRCEQGRVLLLDNELLKPTIAHRLPLVSEAMGFNWAEVKEQIDIISLRGTGVDLLQLEELFGSTDRGRYSLVVLDAWYRFFPKGVSENDNADVMALYNTIDGYAGRLDAAFVCVHHTSKGAQDTKAVTDVGAGAGSQSRAADTHLILRPHQDDGVVVLEAAVRSFAPIDPLCVRWDYPVWRLAKDADPRRLKRTQSQRELKQAADDEEGFRKIVAALFKHGEGTARQLRGWAGIGQGRADRLLDVMQADGQLIRTETERRGNVCGVYTLAPADESDI